MDNVEDGKSYRKKFIRGIKDITQQTDYKEGLKEFKLLALYDKNSNKLKKNTKLTEHQKNIIEGRIKADGKNYCLCSHYIERISFWEYGDKIYFIGCDCVRNHPYFDKFMCGELEHMENDIKIEIREEKKSFKTLNKRQNEEHIQIILEENKNFESMLSMFINGLERAKINEKKNIDLILNYTISHFGTKKTVKELFNETNATGEPRIKWYLFNYEKFKTDFYKKRFKHIIKNKLYE